jgi:quercetin dioxygenase-like cupin family protein
MEHQPTPATSLPSTGEHLLDAPLFTIDLPLLIEQIKNGPAWKTGKRSAVTVYKTAGLRIVLMALHEGTEIARHMAEGIITVQVIHGHIHFNTDQQSVELSSGQMLTLHEKIPHSVVAKKETVFLLTLAGATAPKQ